MADPVTPETLCAKNTEDGHQAAFFCWANRAKLCGFSIADDMTAYSRLLPPQSFWQPEPRLRWLHHIPNGGARDPITAARMRKIGVIRGVPDVFLPVAREINEMDWLHGLYIEMKTTTGRLSDEQTEFQTYAAENDFAFHVCRNWREAADVIKEYLS